VKRVTVDNNLEADLNASLKFIQTLTINGYEPLLAPGEIR
jgi:hypothetical protein